MQERRKLSDDELELEFEEAYREIIGHKELLVKAVSDSVRKGTFILSITTGLFCIFIGAGLVLGNIAQVIIDITATGTLLAPSLAYNVLFFFLGLSLCSLAIKIFSRLSII